MSDSDDSDSNVEEGRASFLRYRRKLMKPFRHIITDITDPETKTKLIEKIRECVKIMEENIDHTTLTIPKPTCVLEAHPIMGPPLMDLYDAGIVLPRVIRPPDAIRLLESVAEYLGKRRPRSDPPGFCMGHQFVQQVNGLRDVLHRPQSALGAKLEQMRYDLHHPSSSRNLGEKWSNDVETSDSN